MRHHIRSTSVCVLIFCILYMTIATVYATDESNNGISPYASNYIRSDYAYAEPGTGSVAIHFNITATGKMSSLGASKIKLYTYDGTCVKTYYASSTSGMLGSGQYAFSGIITYYGAKSGTTYYAVVTFKASDSTGGDSSTYTTNYATVK